MRSRFAARRRQSTSKRSFQLQSLPRSLSFSNLRAIVVGSPYPEEIDAFRFRRSFYGNWRDLPLLFRRGLRPRDIGQTKSLRPTAGYDERIGSRYIRGRRNRVRTWVSAEPNWP